MDDQDLHRLVVEHLRSARQGFGLDDAEPAGGALDLTSLEVVRLLVRLEEELDTEIDEAAIMNVRLDTVDDVVALLRESAGVSPLGAGE